MGQLNGAEEHMTPEGCGKQHRGRGHYEPMVGGVGDGSATGPEGMGKKLSS